MTQTTLLDIDKRIATITLNRPERLNAINPALLTDFAAALREARDNPSVEVIVLTGAGRAFCAGDDLKEFDQQVGTEAETRAYIEQIQSITHLMMGHGKPIIGAVRGWAVGGGFEWVLNCDFAIFSQNARCFFPEIQLGVFVTGAVMQILPQLVGLQKAKEMILLGHPIDAEQALAHGIALRVVEDDQLLPEAMALAEQLLKLPRIARENVKKVMHQSIGLNLTQTMQLETGATVQGFLDPQTRHLVADRL